MTSPPRPKRVLLPKTDRLHLRRLADAAEGFTTRADESHDDPDHYDVGYGTGVADVLRWLAGDDPTDYLTETLTD